MVKYSFNYTIVEDYIEVNAEVKKVIKAIKLTKDKVRPEMNFTSFHEHNENLNKLVNNKLSKIFKNLNLTLQHCWVQQYIKNSYHSVHTHDPKGKSFVWFIEGNKDSSPLCFYDVGYPAVDINENIIFDFTPGKLIIFPGFIPHEVRPNKSNNRLIVSGNVI